MRRTDVTLMTCMALAACVSPYGGAHGQASDAQFWMVTELGNVFLIEGPPPDRPPGFDSAPFLNARPLDTVFSLTAGPAPGVKPVAIFGEAGIVTKLPEYHPERGLMYATVVRDWGSDSRFLYATVPVGELGLYGSLPYLGPARVRDVAGPDDPEPVDLLKWCNDTVNATNPDGTTHPLNGTLVSCVDNHGGRNLTAAYAARYVGGEHAKYGHTLQLPPTGKSIVHVHSNSTGPHWFEVMFTCPACTHNARAFHGHDNDPANDFMERGFRHDPATVAPPAPPLHMQRGNLTGLAWGGVTGPHGTGYWQDGGGCTPSLGISGGTIVGGCPITTPDTHIQAGTILADTWTPLVPGWNLVEFPTHASYIVISDPGSGARLQIREANQTYPGCCHGFDGGLHHVAHEPGQPPRAAVFHNTDRHLLILPYRGSVPYDHPTLRDMQEVQLAAREVPRNAPRWLSHSEQGDPTYHGLLYGEHGDWPPYMVRLVGARHIDFDMPHTDILEYMAYGNYTQEDLRRILDMDTPAGPLLDSQIYDIRNDKALLTDEGRFILWDGTETERPYIQPWMDMRENPIWDLYGAELPEDEMLIIDTYATIPAVTPTRLSGTYLSSLPCGHPDVSEATHKLRDVIFDTFHSGIYDPNLMEFLLLADHVGDISDNLTLQLIYGASRTYLDYLDGFYLAGEEIHVPVLGNRPYLCTTIAPNILESQYMLYGLPYGGTYLSLGGTEGTALTRDLAGEGAAYERTLGVQSPRDGVVALDVTARFGAAVSAFGIGDAHPGRTAPTGQWLHGTMRVNATLGVGADPDEPAEPANQVLLAEFDVDMHDIYEESYKLHDDRCYGRFVTVPDNSPYVVKTVTYAAALGEHIPVALRLTASESDVTTVEGPYTHNKDDRRFVGDAGIRSTTSSPVSSIHVPEHGMVHTMTLTVTVDDSGTRALDWSAAGGTDFRLVAPSGTEHTVPRAHTSSDTHVHDVSSLFLEEPLQGRWTLLVIDYGDQNPAYHRDHFYVESWGLEFTRTDGLTVGPICDVTDFESTVVQFLLRTFSIDVR